MSALLDRGAAPLRSRSWLRTPGRKRAARLLGGAAVLGVAGWAVLGVVQHKAPEAPVDDGSKAVIGQVVPPPPLPLEGPSPIKQVAAAIPLPSPSPLVAPPPKISDAVPHAPRELAAPVEVFVSAGGASGGAARVPGARGGAGSAGKTTVAWKPSTLPGAKAGAAIDLTYTMMPQFIGCALDNAVDSTLPGPLLCHTVRDVMSPRGVVLMRAGTTIIGEYRNAVRTGQGRLLAATATAYTPEGIPVPLDAPMADGLGRAGVSGQVDDHLLERFGGGVLLMLTEGAFGLGQAALAGNGNTYLNVGGGAGPQDVASQVLQQQMNIPPTISAPPGAVVTIITTHPISFADALRVRPIEGGG